MEPGFHCQNKILVFSKLWRRRLCITLWLYSPRHTSTATKWSAKHMTSYSQTSRRQWWNIQELLLMTKLWIWLWFISRGISLGLHSLNGAWKVLNREYRAIMLVIGIPFSICTDTLRSNQWKLFFTRNHQGHLWVPQTHYLQSGEPWSAFQGWCMTAC